MSAKLLIDIPVSNWCYTILLDPEKEYSLGSGRENLIHLPPGMSAASHASILKRERWQLKDFGSEYGTYINGAKAREATLSDGDHIRVGRCDIVFQNPEDRGEWGRAKNLVAVRESALRQALAKSEEIVLLEELSTEELPGESAVAEGQPLTENSRITPISSIEKSPEALTGDDLVWVAQTLAAILSDVLSKPGSRDEIFDLMLRELKDAIDADNGFVMIPNFETGRWVIRAWTGDSQAWSSYEKTHPVPLTVTNRAFEKMKVVSNALRGHAGEEDEELTSLSMQALNVNGYIAIPLMDRGKRRGVLYFDTRNIAREFEPRDVKLLERAGAYILEIEDQKA